MQESESRGKFPFWENRRKLSGKTLMHLRQASLLGHLPFGEKSWGLTRTQIEVEAYPFGGPYLFQVRLKKIMRKF